MKKGLALILSVLTLLVSICSVLISVRTMKMVEGLKQTQQVENVVDASEVINSEDAVGENPVEDLTAENQQQASSETVTPEQTTPAESETQETTNEETQTETSVVETPTPQPVVLTDEEVQKRKEQQLEIKAARDFLFSEPRTLENTQKINTFNKMLIATNTYDFSWDNILFVGDSITEGVGSTPDELGRMVGYPTYISKYFSFQTVWNNGEGGWFYSDFGGDEYSIVSNVDTKINNSADIMVFFAGINDYIARVDNKRFGTYADGHATAGYCGQVSYLMDHLQRYFSEDEIFFVLMYPVNVVSGGKYTDPENDHSLKEYIEAQRVLAEAHGFHVIDLYTTGVLDGTVPEIAAKYLSDALHPNDAGYQLIADYIAAELAFYYTQNK